ncbi:glycosyltransferase [Aquipseudomonas ullengensis]|uniref:Glycosyltransferase n=1 Tax=Aquipseudomonas ullengensis TaxID=2759166 RepID=A0A7W4LJN0_9GAMM|nr:glycosyltransferase [Pseudomonas ullengensis]MBB2494404.1 glycosyltransferase [Pseudomonas ullengensis]
MSTECKKILVVLGMHRSGTSALTRGLQVIGVSLGDNLMPAFEGNNNKGFWEDLEIVALNDALLAELGLNWHSLGTLQTPHDWARLLDHPLAAQAEAYLQAQTVQYPLFGLKDPRMTRLLPFWLEIFKRCNVEPIFLISSRDPLSVSRSLEKRDNFLAGKNYFLWLEHALPALLDTAGYRRLVVDFNQLLEQPARELERIARLAGLPQPAEIELNTYQDSFLESGLRHYQHTQDDLRADPSLAEEIVRVHQLLQQLATDAVDLDDPAVRTELQEATAWLNTLGPTYRLVIAQNARITSTSEHLDALRKENAHLHHVTQALTDTQQELADTHQALIDIQQDLHDLSRSIDALRQSASWRITQPLRAVTSGARETVKTLRASARLMAKRLYHRLPAKLREPCLRLAYRYFGIFFRGMGHYEAWRLAWSPGQTRPFSFSYRRSALAREGQYQLEQTTYPAYCYLPPRRTSAVDKVLAEFGRKPLISIITPVYGIEPPYLQALIQSVEQQWYPHWELIFVEDAGPNPATRHFLEALDNPRIKVSLSEKNGGISAASNIALGLAAGEYVAFLDHDDELTADALFELAKAINTDDPDFIYSDEDKIDDAGNYSQPFFKPGWSPDALMSIMYTCHLACMRKSLVDELGGFRSCFDGAQDYDLALRLTERTQRIHHIPKVLYHWRTLPSSTASGLDAKPYASDAMRRLKEEALVRRGLQGIVENVAEMPSQCRVNYRPVGTPLVSIIIPSRDNTAILKRCVDSLLQQTRYGHYEIILIDNDSSTPEARAYFDQAPQDPRVTVLRYPHPFNYSAINNLGAREAKGDYLLFLNDDTEALAPDWLERMLGFAQLDHIGAVGAKLLFPGSHNIQHCGVLNLPAGPGHAFYNAPADAPIYFGRNILEWNWLAATGACLLVKRSKFEAVGGFDESFPVAYNDVDLCWRLHDQGLKNLVCNAVRLLHHESVSRGVDDEDPLKLQRLTQERRRLYQKHPGYFMHDPYFNPNLHGSSVNFLAQNF